MWAVAHYTWTEIKIHIKKNTNDDTEIYCTGIRILVQPFINSDNTFDALAIDEFEVYNDTQAPTHITPRMFSRFIDPSRIVSATNEPIITTYYVDSNATSDDISNNTQKKSLCHE